ncbi:acid-sensing ion channel 5-like [Ptychodera flava]|uniref:acid-sensing ion channel 5-like n=1 Tax=Ptychodera flava TaxID=63121 RepID=UPI00396A5D90
MYYLLSRDKLDCGCNQACAEEWYEYTISQGLWPSDTYFKHLVKQVHFKNNKTRNLNDFESVSKNLINLEVYFDELNYENIEEIPAVTEESLLSDIGGTLGLYCGFSFITIVEFMQFFVELMFLTYMKYVHRRLTPTITD